MVASGVLAIPMLFFVMVFIFFTVLVFFVVAMMAAVAIISFVIPAVAPFFIPVIPLVVFADDGFCVRRASRTEKQGEKGQFF